MSLISFLKDAGAKLFGKDVQAAQSDPARVAEANRAAATAIEQHIATYALDVTGLTVTFDSSSSTAKVYGIAADQATREKAILAAGNVQGVAAVENQMTVVQSAPEAQYYTVVKGDTLSKIAQQFYGKASEYPRIFEANRPLLAHPDKICPGRNLRSPPQG